MHGVQALLTAWVAPVIERVNSADAFQREDCKMETIAVTPCRAIHACLCEIERGLFHISYRTGTPDRQTHGLPSYQLGACASDAMQRFEACARIGGYGFVVWDTAPGGLAIADAREA